MYIAESAYVQNVQNVQNVQIHAALDGSLGQKRGYLVIFELVCLFRQIALRSLGLPFDRNAPGF